MTQWICLTTIATIYKSLLNKELSISIVVVLSWTFLNTFIKIAILGKLYFYQCNICYTKFGQHWIKCLCVHSSSIIHLFDYKKIGRLHLNWFSQKFPNYGLFSVAVLVGSNLTPTRSNHLAKIATINKGFLNKKLLLSIVAFLT